MKERRIPWWFRKQDENTPVPVGLKPDFTAISAVNERLLQLLHRHLVPEMIPSREEIGLCAPKEHGDLVLGVCLYDIRENSEIRISGIMAEGDQMRFPPLYLDLYYMITAYSSIHIKYREEENHRILTKVMQALHDYPKLEGEDHLHAEIQNLTLDQKLSIWNSQGSGYHLSLFYKIAPVMLSSQRIVDGRIARVREIGVEAILGENKRGET